MIQPLTLSNGQSLLDALRQSSIEASLRYQRHDKQFLTLLESLQELADHLVWLKGTTFSRTLYDIAEHRVSLDFDVAVAEGSAQAVLDRLEQSGFTPNWTEPGYCHQVGVGPVGALADLFLRPNPEFEGCHNLTLEKTGWPAIELKFNPLDTGLRMKEESRFFADAEKISWAGHTFLGPSVVDHMLIAVVHFHKHGFMGWGWLYDIHLLALHISGQPNQWAEFVRRCQYEGIGPSAWKSLRVVQGQLGTPVPKEVLKAIEPPQSILLDIKPLVLITTEFLWNCTSLGGMLMNAIFMGDTKRKLTILARSFFPDPSFLSQYYAHGARISGLSYMPYLLMHWAVLISPAGLIRRTIGQFIWPYDVQSLGKK